MTENREDCQMRHENGNCAVIGGFCTAVNDPICAGLHNAYDCGYCDGEIRAKQELEQEQDRNDYICTLKCTALMEEGMCSHGGLCCLHESQRIIQEKEPLTLNDLRKMDAPVWLRCYQVDGDGYWCLCKNGIIITPAGNRYDVSEIPHWAFYRQKPEEVDDG